MFGDVSGCFRVRSHFLTDECGWVSLDVGSPFLRWILLLLGVICTAVASYCKTPAADEAEAAVFSVGPEFLLDL